MSKLSASAAILISFLLLIQMVPGDSSGVHVTNDLYIADVDLVQVTYDPPTIIKNKSVALRLVVISTFQDSVHTEFRINYDFGRKNLTDKGPDGNGIPLTPGQNILYLPGGSYYLSDHWDTEPMTLSWTSTGNDTDLTVIVDPSHGVAETVETNNVYRYTDGVVVKSAQPMRMLVVPIYNDVDGQYEFEEYLDRNIAVLRDQYPVADDGINVTIAPWEHAEYEDHNEAADIARSFSDDARAMGYDRVIVVFKYLYYGTSQLYGRACGMLRDPEDRVPFLVTQVGLSHSSDLLAHELGHTYYLWHPHDIGLVLYETDIWNPLERMYAWDASTTMSYDWKLPEGVPSSPRWMDEQRYRTYPKTWIDLKDRDDVAVDGVWQWNLYSQFVTNPLLKKPSVLIAGKLFLDGSAILGQHVQHLAAAPRDLEQAVGFVNSGNYSFRVLDSSQFPLGTFPFQASFNEMAHWDSITDTYERRLNEVEFVFNIPEVAGAKYLQLINQTGAVLVQRTISDNAPTVQVITPSLADEVEVGEVLNITWEGNDLDDDELVYRLAFSVDGATWIPVVDDITENWYEMSTVGLRPGDDYRVKVVASDGYNSVEGVSDEFSMVDTTPPTTVITVEGESGENGWYVSHVDVELNATDNDRIERTEFRIDGDDWSVYTDVFEMTEEGNISIQYRSIDASGNIESARSANILVDLNGPSIQILDPTNGLKVNSGDLVVRLNSSDTVSGVAGHKVRLDGGDWTDAGAVDHFEMLDVTEGQHTLEVMAIDEAGNYNITSVNFVAEPEQGFPYLLVLVAVIIGIAIIALAYFLLRRKRT
ncbi:MAG: hypothetical protein AB9860_01615 [Methanomassiliicoccales archaeon]